MPILLEDLGMEYPYATSKRKSRYGLYKCECGIEFKTIINNIKIGHTKSCGCYKQEIRTTHGMRGHRLYRTWDNMIQRTSNQKVKHYKNYGGRGIKVCESWLDIHNFIKDMFPSYVEGLTIDRIDVNGNYEPNNCRWTTSAIQNRNTRKIMATNTSGYRGVSFDKERNKWEANIKAGRLIHLGRFNTALEAAIIYDKYVIENNLEHTVNGV